MILFLVRAITCAFVIMSQFIFDLHPQRAETLTLNVASQSAKVTSPNIGNTDITGPRMFCNEMKWPVYIC
jgi:hypothetical protein